MMRRFLGAVQFLTVLPVHAQTSTAGDAAIFFPVIGAVLGVVTGVVFILLEKPLGRTLAAMLSVAFLIGITGALHEDGLADAADAFRAGRSREKIMTILKDSRIGAYGGLALVVSVALRWQALAQCQAPAIWGLMAAVTLSRATLVLLAGIAPAVGDGLGVHFAAAISQRVVAWVSLQVVFIALFCGWQRGIAMVLVSTLLILIARSYFVRHLGGVNGDCLGAACQVVETANLILLAWQPSF